MALGLDRTMTADQDKDFRLGNVRLTVTSAGHYVAVQVEADETTKGRGKGRTPRQAIENIS
jgi:hypothetical protein